MEKFLDRIELLVYYIRNIFLYAASRMNSALRGTDFLILKLDFQSILIRQL